MLVLNLCMVVNNKFIQYFECKNKSKSDLQFHFQFILCVFFFEAAYRTQKVPPQRAGHHLVT